MVGAAAREEALSFRNAKGALHAAVTKSWDRSLMVCAVALAAAAVGSVSGAVLGGLGGFVSWPNRDNALLATFGGASVGAFLLGAVASGGATMLSAGLLIPDDDAAE